MPALPAALCRGSILAGCLVLTFTASSAAQPRARQVLLLNSFERGSAVQNLVAGSFRTELGRQSTEPLNIFEVSLQIPLTGDAPRDRLFPSTPLLLAAVERRLVQRAAFSERETALPVAIDLHRVVEEILHLLPRTTNIFIVIGASRIEAFWREELKRQLQPFESRVTFLPSNDLSYADMLKRAATLPANSAIFYTLLSLDATGVIQEDERTLAELRNVIAHAAASRVDVAVLKTDDQVEISVTDDGRGFESVSAPGKGKGLGLISISERAKIAGGTASIVTAPGQGTRVQAIIPATAAESDQTQGQVA